MSSPSPTGAEMRHSVKPQPKATRLISKNVTVLGKRTTMRLEPEIWLYLDEIAERAKMTVSEVCSKVCGQYPDVKQSSLMRTFVASYYRNAATEEGHRRAGHNSGHLFGWQDMPSTLNRQDGGDTKEDFAPSDHHAHGSDPGAAKPV